MVEVISGIIGKIGAYIGAMAAHTEIIAIIIAIIVIEILTAFFILRRVKMYLKSANQMNYDKIEELKIELSDIKKGSGKLDNVIKASKEVNEALKELSPSADERSAELMKLLQVFLDDINFDKLTEEGVNHLKKDLQVWMDKISATPSEVVEKKRAEVKEGYEKVSSHIKEKSTYMDMHIFRKLLEEAKKFIETGDIKALENEKMNAYQSANIILQILQYLINDYDVSIRAKKLKDLGFY